MDARLESSLSVEFLAAEVGLSPAHFARAFKETLGVAQRAGFADQAHFTRHFKREYGVTPGVVLRSRRRVPPVRE